MAKKRTEIEELQEKVQAAEAAMRAAGVAPLRAREQELTMRLAALKTEIEEGEPRQAVALISEREQAIEGLAAVREELPTAERAAGPHSRAMLALRDDLATAVAREYEALAAPRIEEAHRAVIEAFDALQALDAERRALAAASGVPIPHDLRLRAGESLVTAAQLLESERLRVTAPSSGLWLARHAAA